MSRDNMGVWTALAKELLEEGRDCLRERVSVQLGRGVNDGIHSLQPTHVV